MTGNRAYLDYNASCVLHPAAREAMMAAITHCGNASSVHGEGRALRHMVEQARTEVAALVAANVESVVFTASATEAAPLALAPQISVDETARPANRLYVLETEHPSVLAGGRFGVNCTQTIPVKGDGLIDMDALDALLDTHDGGAPYVAVQLANSETGIVQPVSEVAHRVRLKGGYTLCDAVQAAGRLPLDVRALGVDFLILSAHKLGGPQGAGALINVHSMLDFEPAIRGGGQEKNRRAGTENVAAIAGFGAAAGAARQLADDYLTITALRDSIEAQLMPICASQGLASRLKIWGADVPRVGNTLLFTVEGLNAETALIAFDLDGVAVSSGSACSSGKVGQSHVLRAMGASASQAQAAIRVSLGWKSCDDDVNAFIAAFERIIARLAGKASLETNTRISGAA